MFGTVDNAFNGLLATGGGDEGFQCCVFRRFIRTRRAETGQAFRAHVGAFHVFARHRLEPGEAFGKSGLQAVIVAVGADNRQEREGHAEGLQQHVAAILRQGRGGGVERRHPERIVRLIQGHNAARVGDEHFTDEAVGFFHHHHVQGATVAQIDTDLGATDTDGAEGRVDRHRIGIGLGDFPGHDGEHAA